MRWSMLRAASYQAAACAFARSRSTTSRPNTSSCWAESSSRYPPTSWCVRLVVQRDDVGVREPKHRQSDDLRDGHVELPARIDVVALHPEVVARAVVVTARGVRADVRRRDAEVVEEGGVVRPAAETLRASGRTRRCSRPSCRTRCRRPGPGDQLRDVADRVVEGWRRTTPRSPHPRRCPCSGTRRRGRERPRPGPRRTPSTRTARTPRRPRCRCGWCVRAASPVRINSCSARPICSTDSAPERLSSLP